MIHYLPEEPILWPWGWKLLLYPSLLRRCNLLQLSGLNHLGVGKMQNFQTQEGKFICVSFTLAISSNPTLDSAAKCSHSVGLLDAGISRILKYCIIGIGKKMTLE